MAAEKHQQDADELVLRDLPGKLAILLFAAATLALGWELSGTIFQFGWPFIRPLATIEASHIIGAVVFTTGWFGILISLLALSRTGATPAPAESLGSR